MFWSVKLKSWMVGSKAHPNYINVIGGRNWWKITCCQSEYISKYICLLSKCDCLFVDYDWKSGTWECNWKDAPIFSLEIPGSTYLPIPAPKKSLVPVICHNPAPKDPKNPSSCWDLGVRNLWNEKYDFVWYLITI